MTGLQRKWIDRAVEDPSPLNTWEQDFIESLSDLPDDWELTDGQNRKLNEIAQKYS